jgi:hypothetical protein
LLKKQAAVIARTLFASLKNIKSSLPINGKRLCGSKDATQSDELDHLQTTKTSKLSKVSKVIKVIKVIKMLFKLSSINHL